MKDGTRVMKQQIRALSEHIDNLTFRLIKIEEGLEKMAALCSVTHGHAKAPITQINRKIERGEKLRGVGLGKEVPVGRRVTVVLTIAAKGVRLLSPYLKLRWRGMSVKVGYRDMIPPSVILEALKGGVQARVVATTPPGRVLVGPGTKFVVKCATT